MLSSLLFLAKNLNIETCRILKHLRECEVILFSHIAYYSGYVAIISVITLERVIYHNIWLYLKHISFVINFIIKRII